jgi:hypothetical protein
MRIRGRTPASPPCAHGDGPRTIQPSHQLGISDRLEFVVSRSGSGREGPPPPVDHFPWDVRAACAQLRTWTA